MKKAIILRLPVALEVACILSICLCSDLSFVPINELMERQFPEHMHI